MTNMEYKLKYPVGTKIKYISSGSSGYGHAHRDRGKVGKIVGFNRDNEPIIYLPTSTHVSWHSTKLVPATWGTTWERLEILPQKNCQLLFSFMEK